MGKDFIIIETVGVGQNEVDIARYAHTTIIVTIPGMGDGIQALKAGILEVGDIFVVNKADKEGADATVAELERMVGMGPRKCQPKGWKPPILKTQALFDSGIDDLIKKIEAHQQWVMNSFETLSLWRRKEWLQEELLRMIKDYLIEDLIDKIKNGKAFEKKVSSILAGEENTYNVCEDLFEKKLNEE